MNSRRYIVLFFVAAFALYIAGDVYIYLSYKHSERTAGALKELVDRYAKIPGSKIPGRLVLAYEKVYPGTLSSGFHADLAWLFVTRLQQKHSVEFDLAYEGAHTGGIQIHSMANQLNGQLTKEQCIYGYLSEFDFDFRVKGVERAALFYYQKELKELSEKECLELVVMTINPSLYDKRRNPEVLEEKVRSYY